MQLKTEHLYLLMAVREKQSEHHSFITPAILWALMRQMKFYKFQQQDMSNIYNADDIDFSAVEGSMNECTADLNELVESGMLFWVTSDVKGCEPEQVLRITRLGQAQVKGYRVPREIDNECNKYELPYFRPIVKKKDLSGSLRRDLAGLTPFKAK